MTTVMYDSVTVSAIPSTAPACAGYVGGRWPTFSTLVKLFPNAKHLSIAVNASQDADCLDIERGDAVPADAPIWYARQKARGVARPCFYADASTMPAVLAALGAAGIGRTEFRVWTAHFTNIPHLEAGSDATQWTDRALGRNLDESLCVDTFFDASIQVWNPPHYERFDAVDHLVDGKTLNELALVRKYDRLRRHGLLNVIRLAPVRRDLATLAGRVQTVAQNDVNDNGNPSWGKYHRGWRYQELIHRAQGQQFV